MQLYTSTVKAFTQKKMEIWMWGMGEQETIDASWRSEGRYNLGVFGKQETDSVLQATCLVWLIKIL